MTALNPFVLMALAIGLWGGWRILRWMSSGGRLPARRHRGSASAFANVGLTVQALFQPGAKQVLEAKQQAETQREDEAEGDPPTAG